MSAVQFVLEYWYGAPLVVAIAYVGYLHVRRRLIGDDS